MSHSLEHELVRNAGALRALAAALVGHHDADDLVQETALQALRLPPRQPGPLGGWLAGIVRHLAFRQRRDERRRRQREQAAARREVQPADRSVEDRETLRALTEAVLALPEPYREAVIDRYLRDLRPAAIAARDGVPLDTVKSRIKRGQKLLRAHLASRGGDFRLALATAFGFEPAATKTTGGLLMGMTAKAVIGCATAAIAVACALLWFGEGPEGQVRHASSDAVAGPLAASAKAARTGEAGADQAARRLAPEPSGSATTAPAVRGRCVDPQQAPVAGCSISVASTGGETTPAVSAPDGTFTLRCPAASTPFIVCVRREGCAPQLRQCSAIAAGQVIDLGAVQMQRVRDVHLRTVDGRGAATSAFVSFEGAMGLRTASDGTASVQLLPGNCQLRAVPTALVSQVQVPDGEGVCELVIPVGPEGDCIDGSIVDEGGAPMAGAMIYLSTLGGSAGCRAGTDGTFALARASPASPAALVELTIAASGFEIQRLPTVAWNAHGMRIALRSGTKAELHVRRSDGKPVEEFNAQIRDSSGPFNDRQVAGRFPGGIAVIDGVRRGPVQVFVVPADADVSSRLFVPCTIADTGPNRIEIVLPAVARRPLRVQTSDGTPVAGAPFELMQAVQGHKPQLQSWAGIFLDGPEQYELRDPAAPPAVLVQQGTTDADGRATLRGPADELLAVRIGAAETVLVDDVSLTASELLVITVSPAGTLRGRVGPAEFLARLSTMQVQAYGGTNLRLSFQQGPRNVECALAEDGTFTQVLLPGTWQVAVPLRLMGDFMGFAAGTAAVQANSVTEQSFELVPPMPSEVRAKVTVDGEPAGKCLVVLADRDRKTLPGKVARGWTDADGSVRLCAAAATYRVSLAGIGSLRLAEPVVVTPGTDLDLTLAFVSGSIRLRIVDSNGQPRVGIRPACEDTAGQTRFAPSDLDGRTSLRVAPGTYALSAWWPEYRPEARVAPQLELGTFEVAAGKVTDREVRLPPEWDR